MAEACIACRSHYVDLADGRRFVCDFDELDREARRRDVLLVTGASTLPALSSAVVDSLSADMAQIDSIRTVILPAGRSLPGAATFGAVMEYCGKPVRTFENGAWVSRTGWEDARRLLIDGKVRNAAVCDVPDLELFPRHYDCLRTATFHAGPEWAWQHRFIRIMARLVRRGWIESWSPYARLLQHLNSLTSVAGSATGYMQVEVQGEDNARRAIVRQWNLIAGQNHGPEIPCMPAQILAKKLIAGETRARGARPCLGLMDIDDFAREVATLDISWSVEQASSC